MAGDEGLRVNGNVTNRVQMSRPGKANATRNPHRSSIALSHPVRPNTSRNARPVMTGDTASERSTSASSVARPMKRWRTKTSAPTAIHMPKKKRVEAKLPERAPKRRVATTHASAPSMTPATSGRKMRGLSIMPKAPSIALSAEKGKELSKLCCRR